MKDGMPAPTERRTVARFACSYDMEISTKGGPLKGIGLEISSSGVAFIMPRSPGVDTLDVVALIRNHKVPLTLKIVRSDPMSYQLETWFKLACSIAVRAPAWDAIIAEMTQSAQSRGHGASHAAPAAASSALKTGAVASAAGEISFGALPAVAQQSIIEQLIGLKRLARPRPGHAPLVRVSLGPEYHDAYGKTVHRYRVHSRVVQHNHTTTSFESIFLVSERGDVKLER